MPTISSHRTPRTPMSSTRLRQQGTQIISARSARDYEMEPPFPTPKQQQVQYYDGRPGNTPKNIHEYNQQQMEGAPPQEILADQYNDAPSSYRSQQPAVFSARQETNHSNSEPNLHVPNKNVYYPEVS